MNDVGLNYEAEIVEAENAFVDLEDEFYQDKSDAEKATREVRTADVNGKENKVNDEFCPNDVYIERESREVWSFKSEYSEEEIQKCLDNIFKNTRITSKKVIHRDQLRGALYLYTLELKIDQGKLQKRSFSWPKMLPSQVEIFQYLKRIS